MTSLSKEHRRGAQRMIPKPKEFSVLLAVRTGFDLDGHVLIAWSPISAPEHVASDPKNHTENGANVSVKTHSIIHSA